MLPLVYVLKTLVSPKYEFSGASIWIGPQWVLWCLSPSIILFHVALRRVWMTNETQQKWYFLGDLVIKALRFLFALCLFQPSFWGKPAAVWWEHSLMGRPSLWNGGLLPTATHVSLKQILLPQSGLQLHRPGQYLDCILKETSTWTYLAKWLLNSWPWEIVGDKFLLFVYSC